MSYKQNVVNMFDTLLTEFYKLTDSEQSALNIIGINEPDLIRNQSVGKRTRIHVIGFMTMLMYHISKGVHPALVADKFRIDRGNIQKDYTAVISEAARLSVFCSQMEEFWYFSALFDKLVVSLSYSQYPELYDLLQISQLKPPRARLLYDADITTPAAIVGCQKGILSSKSGKYDQYFQTIFSKRARVKLQ